MRTTQKSRYDDQIAKIRKAEMPHKAEIERDRIQDEVKMVQRSLTDRHSPPLSPITILSLQETVGKRAIQRMLQDLDSSSVRPKSSQISNGQIIQRADYGYYDEPLHDSTSSQSQSSKTKSSDDGGGSSDSPGTIKEIGDDGGDGYGYEFGDDPLLSRGTGPSDGGDVVESPDDDSGGGYGYEFGEDPLSAGGF